MNPNASPQPDAAAATNPADTVAEVTSPTPDAKSDTEAPNSSPAPDAAATNPPDAETPRSCSSSSSADSEWYYLNQTVTSSEDEEEDESGWETDGNASSNSDGGATTPDDLEEDCSSGSVRMDEASQKTNAEPQMDVTPSQPCTEEEHGSQTNAEPLMDVTPSHPDVEEEEDGGQTSAEPLMDSQSIEIVLSPIKEEDEDELDGGMLKLFSDIVKCVVMHILQIVIREHNEFLCYGCKISHGSQKQHTCLFGVPNNFLRKHYDALEKKVLTERFLLAASQLLEKYDINVSEGKIRDAAESTLLGLKSVRNLEKTAERTITQWVGGCAVKMINLKHAEKMWAGEEEWDGVMV